MQKVSPRKDYEALFRLVYLNPTSEPIMEKKLRMLKSKLSKQQIEQIEKKVLKELNK